MAVGVLATVLELRVDVSNIVSITLSSVDGELKYKATGCLDMPMEEYYVLYDQNGLNNPDDDDPNTVEPFEIVGDEIRMREINIELPSEADIVAASNKVYIRYIYHFASSASAVYNTEITLTHNNINDDIPQVVQRYRYIYGDSEHEPSVLDWRISGQLFLGDNKIIVDKRTALEKNQVYILAELELDLSNSLNLPSGEDAYKWEYSLDFSSTAEEFVAPEPEQLEGDMLPVEEIEAVTINNYDIYAKPTAPNSPTPVSFASLEDTYGTKLTTMLPTDPDLDLNISMTDANLEKGWYTISVLANGEDFSNYVVRQLLYNYLATQIVYYDESIGFYVEMGEYPQSYVGNTLNTILENTWNNNEMTATSETYSIKSKAAVQPSTLEQGLFAIDSNDVEYIAYTYEGQKYVRQEVLNSVFIIDNSMAMWYKVEPIKWLVVGYSDADGELHEYTEGCGVTQNLIVFSLSALAGIQWDSAGGVDYESSSIRSWLTGDFFTDSGLGDYDNLVQREYSYSNPNGSSFDMSNTQKPLLDNYGELEDKVWLPSGAEAIALKLMNFSNIMSLSTAEKISFFAFANGTAVINSSLFNMSQSDLYNMYQTLLNQPSMIDSFGLSVPFWTRTIIAPPEGFEAQMSPLVESPSGIYNTISLGLVVPIVSTIGVRPALMVNVGNSLKVVS